MPQVLQKFPYSFIQKGFAPLKGDRYIRGQCETVDMLCPLPGFEIGVVLLKVIGTMVTGDAIVTGVMTAIGKIDADIIIFRR